MPREYIPGQTPISTIPIIVNIEAAPPPPATFAPPTLGAIPVVSTSPTPGQGIALDLNGNIPTSAAATSLRRLTADPASPTPGEMWYRTDTSEFCVRHDGSTTKRVTLA